MFSSSRSFATSASSVLQVYTVNQISHMWEGVRRSVWLVASSLQKQLARYLRTRRGDLSYPEFSRKTGISASSLHRMEMGEQNVTLKSLESLMKRLNCRITDIFE
jgi:DNA-binding Xre family transcriptional regulator